MPTNPDPNAGDSFVKIATGRNANAHDIATLVNSHNWFPDWKTNPKARNDFETAIAIALAESSGNTNAKNGSHYGLWQIGYDAHRNLFTPGRNPYDPDTNCSMAIAVYREAHNTFRPWTTYTGGKYRDFMPAAHKAADASVSIDNGGADDANLIDKGLTKGKNAVDVLNPANWIPGILKFLADGAVVIGASLLALVLLALGVWLLISETDTGKKLSKVAETAAVPETALI